MKLARRARAERGGGRRIALWVGCAILAIIVLLCVFGPIISPYSAGEFAGRPFLGPSWSHPFGTDSFGRDVFVRVWVGGRLDLFIAAVVVGASLVIGTIIGVISGATKHRWLDSVLMRTVDAIVAFPFLILILALIVVVGRDKTVWVLPAGAPAIILAIIVVDWSIYARLARGETLALRESEYVTAARMVGYPQRQIIRRQLMGGVVRVTASYAVADVILVVVAAASLAFLGSGVQAPAPEWGGIMYEGRSVLQTSWWITTFPGIVLAVTGLSITLVADSLLKVKE
jgi:peptide/nickel transport system permease protein